MIKSTICNDVFHAAIPCFLCILHLVSVTKSDEVAYVYMYVNLSISIDIVSTIRALPAYRVSSAGWPANPSLSHPGVMV